MKKTILKTLFLSVMLISLSSTWLIAQNDTPTCYAPLVGTGKTATAIINSAVCVGTGSPCNVVTNIGNVVDTDTTNFSTVSSTVTTLPVGSGVTVKDAINTYPAGYIAGYVLDLGGSTFLNANVLSAFTIRTFNNDISQETSTSASLASATAIGTSPGKVYLTFKTTLPFDEVRFVLNTAFSAFSNFRIYYAVAFDSNCGFSEDNGRCGDQIGGASSVVTFNGGQLNLLSSIVNAGNIIDGNKNSFATITTSPIAVGTTLLGGQDPYVGVLHQQQIYAPNTRVGFVISQNNIVNLNLFNGLRIQTYLFGVLQDERPVSSNTVSVTAFTGTGDRTSVSIVTTKQYNEVRLVLARTIGLNIGTLNVYYAFEQPNTCSNCVETIVSGTNSPFTINPTIVGNRTGELGLCLGDDLSQTANVVDADTTTFAAYSFGNSLGIGCGFQLSVGLLTGSDTVARGTITGFIISKRGGSLIGTGILENLVIRTFRNGQLQNISTDANLLGLTVLSSASGDRDTISFRAPLPFNEVQIRFNNLLGVNLVGNDSLRIYNAFVIRDNDSDGIPNCQDQCATGNDAIDTDSDGIADCFAIILPLTLSDFTAKAVSNKQVMLSWQTLNEVNTKQFTIERSNKPSSVNSADWQTVGTVTAAGTVSGSRSYQLTDNQPVNGTSYYRLRTTDKDGKQSFSEIRQVNFRNTGLLLSAIYPNPVVRNGAITVAVAEAATYRLLDNTGRLVNTGKIPVGNSQLKVPSTAGTYLLEIAGSSNTANKEHHRITVQ